MIQRILVTHPVKFQSSKPGSQAPESLLTVTKFYCLSGKGSYYYHSISGNISFPSFRRLKSRGNKIEAKLKIYAGPNTSEFTALSNGPHPFLLRE